MRKLILITAILFLGAVQFTPALMAAQQRRQILAAMVMISMTTPNWQQTVEPAAEALPIPNDEYRPIARADGDVVAEGLGTLVIHGGETLLVTHDHWSHFDAALGTVTLRDARGALMGEMALRAFRQHLRFRDGGTMVLTAPEVVATAVSPRSISLNPIQIGDEVLLSQRAGDRVVLTEASVVAQDEKQGRPAVRLRSANGETVVGGDSGGGVWANGSLAATMWTTVMMENTTTGEQRATDMSVAAVYAALPSTQ